MNEPISRLNAEDVQADETPTEEVAETQVLPSDAPIEEVTTEPTIEGNGFEEYSTDGKLFGKYDTSDPVQMKAFAESYKKMQDDKAQSGRESKETETKATEDANSQSVQDAVTNQLAENNFAPTDEMYAEWEKTGKSRESLELTGMKLQKTTERIHNMVGGKEVADNVAQWAKETLSDEQLSGFNKDVASGGLTLNGLGEIAIRGMMSMYTEAQGATGSKIIQGRPTASKSVGYTSQAEVNHALEQLRRNPNDRALVAQHEAKYASRDRRVIR